MIRRLLLLNGLATLAVVINHAIGWGFTTMFWWTDRYRAVSVPNFDDLGSPTYYTLRTVEQLVIAAIPTFLFVSGFFVAMATGRNNPTLGWRVVGTRIVNLVIPYLLWSILIFVVDFVLLDVQQTPSYYLVLLLFGGAISGFYYVPLLCQLYLLSPFLVPLAKGRWQLLLIAALLIQGFVQLSHYQGVLGFALWPFDSIARVPSWAFPGYLFWFSFGIVAGFHLTSFKSWLANIKWGLPPLALLCVLVGIWEWEFILNRSGEEWLTPIRLLSDELASGAIILTFLAFSEVTLPFSNRLGELGQKSYGIYLVHSLVLLWTAKLIYRFEPWLLAYQVLYQPILLVVGVGVPLSLMWLVSRSPARRYYQYIFG
jgi:hypothetical protein